jgi:hypothetical protein
MKLIVEWNEFNKLSLDRFTLSNSERSEVGRLIKRILVSIYGNRMDLDDKFLMSGKSLDPELIRKMINNRLLFNKISNWAKSSNKVELMEFITNNSDELFKPTGKYFNDIYQLLNRSSNKGNRLEKEAFSAFKAELKMRKGVDINIVKPDKDKDISGVDGIFQWRGREFTIQVKTLHKIESFKRDDSKFIVFCDGVLKDLETDYLIVINESTTHIFKSNGVLAYGSYYLIPKDNLII